MTTDRAVPASTFRARMTAVTFWVRVGSRRSRRWARGTAALLVVLPARRREGKAGAGPYNEGRAGGVSPLIPPTIRGLTPPARLRRQERRHETRTPPPAHRARVRRPLRRRDPRPS